METPFRHCCEKRRCPPGFSLLHGAMSTSEYLARSGEVFFGDHILEH